MFVVYSRLSNFSAIRRLSPLPVTVLQIWTYAWHLRLLAVRVLFVPTPTATGDLGLYVLIRRTGTHVPQWDSNHGLKDHQIFAPPHYYIRT
jgi:hypothetical protein